MNASLHAQPLGELLNATAARSPAPGGGAAAAISGATAAALASMVVAYSTDKPDLAPHKPELDAAAAWLSRARLLFLALADEDAAAYAAYAQARKLDKADPARPAAIAEASAACLAAPRSVLAAAADLLRRIEHLAPITNTNLASDIAVAATLAEACAASAAWNIRVNLPMVTDTAQRAEIEHEAEGGAADAAARRARIEAACRAPEAT